MHNYNYKKNTWENEENLSLKVETIILKNKKKKSDIVKNYYYLKKKFRKQLKKKITKKRIVLIKEKKVYKLIKVKKENWKVYIKYKAIKYFRNLE